MKNTFYYLLLIAITLFQSVSFAQSDRSEGITIKEVKSVGAMKRIKVDIVSLTLPIEQVSTSVVKLSYEVSSSYSTDTYNNTLTKEEVESLNNAATYILEHTKQNQPEDYTEIYFNGPKDLQEGAFWSVKDNSWNYFIRLTSTSNSFVSFREIDLIRFHEILEKAHQSL